MSKKLIKRKIKKINKNKKRIKEPSNINKNKIQEINENLDGKKEDEKEDNICIICLANYDNKFHILKKLKCNHTLCENCFNKWYKIKESCPICRKNLFNNPSDHPDFFSVVKDLYLHHDSYFSRGY